MKTRRNLLLGSILLTASVSTLQIWADLFDTNSTTAGFGVANGSTYDWWTNPAWSDTTTVNDGTATTVAWQGTSVTNEQAYFVGSGTAGENYTVRLGATGSTNTYIQNLAINVQSGGSAALAGAAGDVTIGNSGDTGNLVIRANNSVGAQNSGTLTVNNGVNLQSFTLNYRGGITVINGVVSGTGKIAFGSGFGLSGGTLTLANTANSYSGRANSDYITAGYTLAVTKLANGGGSSSIGTSSANIGINGGTLKFIGTGAQSTNLGLHVASSGAFFEASGATTSDTISISGSPTYSAADSARTITLTGSNLGANTMGFVFNNNGTGANVLTKTGTGRWVVNQANAYTGGTNAQNGTLVAANTAAFGAAGRIVNVGFNTSVGAVEFATDTSANAYVLNVSSGYTGTVVINRATSGATMTHTMGNSTLGNGTLNIQKGANVTGDATLEFGGLILSAGATGLSTGTMLNPTNAKVLVSGTITRTGGSANLLTLDGTSSGNVISGVISGPQALTKSNTSTWELSNANTFTGTTKVTGGSLILKNNLALQASAFDTSGAGTLDLTDAAISTLTIGGLIGDSGTGQNVVLPSNVTGLTLNTASGTPTYVKNLSGGTGLTLTKTGAGTQILGGTNTYSGLTTVSGGELRITNANAIGGSNVVVNNGFQLALDGGITVSGKSLATSGSGTNFLGGLQSVSGTNEWAGSVLLGADASRIGARKNATLVVSGTIDDGAGTFGLVVRNESVGNNTNGAGNSNTITILSGVNTYGGTTQIVHGLTKLDGGNNRLPVGTVLQFGLATTNAKFDMNGRNQELAGLAVTSSGTDANRDWNANELTNSSGTRSTLTVNTTADQSFGGTLTNNVGIITGNIDLVKSGSAKLALSGPNTYTGSTTVAAGVLALSGSGSISGSSVIEVQTNGDLDISGLTASTYTIGGAVAQTLKGSGEVITGAAKTLVLGANATLAPGTSPGTLTVTGNLSLGSATVLNWELDPASTSVGGSVNDLVSVTGDLGLDGLLNVFAASGSFSGVTSGTWTLFVYGGTLSDNSLTLNTLPALDPGRTWQLDTNTPSVITLSIVPEPSAALTSFLAAAGLALRRRRPRVIRSE